VTPAGFKPDLRILVLEVVPAIKKIQGNLLGIFNFELIYDILTSSL
jgi:hypothetical protein